MRLLRLFVLRRFGPIGVALTVLDVWRRTRAWAFVAGTIGR